MTPYSRKTQNIEDKDSISERYIENLDDVFYVVDTAGTIVRANEKVTEVTGVTQDELSSIDALELIAPEDRDAMVAQFRSALETGRASVEAHLLTDRGEKVSYEFKKQRFTDDDDTVLGVVGIGRDISERKRRERQLERQTKQYEAFASILSHDLQTPLSVLAGRLELARETGEREHFDAADRALTRVESLLDDLAEVMREGDIAGDLSDVDIQVLARRCWDTLETDAATLEVESVRPFRADESALQRVFENLIQNAIEHGGEGVTVHIGPVSDGFYVEDDGPGVPDGIRAEIFEPGFTTKDEGTGFGMASVRQIALAHGWDVSIADSTTGGARFEFTGVQTSE